jgi:hypothetical protein
MSLKLLIASSSFMDPPGGGGEALRERLGHHARAPHHRSRVEEGELLLGYYSTPYFVRQCVIIA